MKKISKETVHADFNDPLAVVHYARAAHFLGLWESERILIARSFPDQAIPVLEAGCGAGRVTLGLWEMGYRNLAAFDFAEELLDQARSLALERDAQAIHFFHADAVKLTGAQLPPFNSQLGRGFAGALFLFNGLMQIPGRQNRRAALRELRAVCRPGAPLLFTTHDRDDSPVERKLWQQEAERWARGEQDPRLVEFGDRYFENEAGRTFMHLPTGPKFWPTSPRLAGIMSSTPCAARSRASRAPYWNFPTNAASGWRGGSSGLPTPNIER